MKKKIFIITIFSLFVFNFTSAKTSDSNQKFIAYPNPFKPSQQYLKIQNSDKTEITGDVTITIYNSQLKKIYQQKYFASSDIKIRWNGLNKEKSIVRPGLYFIQILQSTYDLKNTINIEIIKVLVQ